MKGEVAVLALAYLIIMALIVVSFIVGNDDAR
jgi:hypothetical protein